MEPPFPSSSISAALFERYVAGEATPAERAQVDAWIAAAPGRADAVDRLRHMRTGVPVNAAEVDATWRTLAARIAEPTQGRGAFRSGSFGRRYPIRAMLGVAAGLVAAVLLAVAIRPRKAPDSFSGLLYTTTVGQRATVRLPDGTRVTLAPNASVRLNANFDGETRRVALTGEAYFEISPTSSHPFVVETGDVQTQVLGTSFAVRRSNPGRPTDVQIVVTNGRVVVRRTANVSRPQSMVLSAGMVGMVTDSSLTSTSVTSIKDYTAWVHGELVFRDAPVTDVLATLERWYGLRFQLNDSTLARQHLSVRFASGPASDMLKALGELLDVNMAFEGDVVTLRPRASSRAPQHNGHRSQRDALLHFDTEVGR